MKRALWWLVGAVGAVGAVGGVGSAWAQAPDTSRPRQLEPLVVTAERTAGSLRASIASVTLLSAAELARRPRATLADLLRLAPGFAVINFDGLGYDPQLMVRGFYGGGEAEYVVVLVDGKPVNQLHNGTVAWDVLPPLASIEAIEVVRGGASSLYGDAAIGGVINVLTRHATDSDRRLQVELGGGAFGTFRAGASLGGRQGDRNLTLAAGVDRTGGFRDHAERSAVRGSGSIDLVHGERSQLSVSLQAHRRSFAEPGPLLESRYAQDRRGSDPLFQFDHTTDREFGAVVEGRRQLGGRTSLSGRVSGELRRIDAIRTLALAPGFGDTKERLANHNRFALNAQLERSETPLPGRGRLIVGIEGTHGGLDSRYYGSESGTRGELDTQGSSARTAGALYTEYAVRLSQKIRVSLGGRFDRLHDSFDPKQPSGEHRSANHSAFSPKAGVNWEILPEGHVYALVSRSFKAPTLDQLYDQRNIPVPFPPFAIQTSNPELDPQRGTTFESGGYVTGPTSEGLWVTFSFAHYWTDMSNELDFDVQTFRYINIGRSRHRGVEAGLQLEGSAVSGYANYALQDATSQNFGSNGLRLKAIPRHTLGGGVSLRPLRKRELLEAALSVTHLRGMYLDDANTRTLPNYTTLDGQLTVQLHGFGLLLEARNLLGAKYSSSGFLDPSGSGEAYLYPAAGRVLQLGIRR